MKWIDKVEVCRSTACDLLHGLFRLNNNDRFLEHLKSSLDKGDFEQDKDIQNWIKETRGILTSDIVQKLEEFFDWETFFGMCLLPDITHSNLENAKQLIEHIKDMPERVLLIHFIYSGYGPRKGTIDMNTFEKIMNNDKELLLFVSSDMSFSTERKAILFEMLSDPSRTKEDFLYLLEWFYENAFSALETRIEKLLLRTASELKKEIRQSGERFLMLLIKNIDYTRYEELKRTVICPSYFSEFLVSNASIPFVNEDMYTVGFRFKEVMSVSKDKLEMTADTFEALAHEKRLAIIRHLSAGKSSGNELARALNLSNYEIGEHTAILRKAGMVRVERMNQMLNFSLDKGAVRREVGKALEDLLKDVES
ncbi:helix-turn-helix transcriptional regulator [Mesotoga sp.]|uniref:ArsR/SmtB family transcription factor n=2 Tax=Mesotoga sp. TaxID=2053577 RepID=UPI00169C6AFA|nr:metalloregulator ArsR/SmtB family transcription factor [Mesotoga sp.]NLT45394.1 helix-turn-helix transcriptional regulator [Thermotogaceae bacterium]MDD3680793.1 metalloregulator ArsR/SmtB family transcription factor [Mesotoga sp.]MDD4207464.1 metalloregulator ArsR/SmtB family transcription factor [Mesotoga sp.]MDD4825669.1 metalloregulator ArsR/SmtB family transcription factor [Mesotoga sp.]MDD5682550.1 metalloregulator ArsR/SmtB family transcription factor [Mesotoga sp.]